MGMTCGLEAAQVVRNTRQVLAIEALAAARALDFLRPLETSPALESITAPIPRLDGDQPVSGPITRVAELIERGTLARAV